MNIIDKIDLNSILNSKEIIKKINIRKILVLETKKFSRKPINNFKAEINLAYGRMVINKKFSISKTDFYCLSNINLIEEFPVINFKCQIKSSDKKDFLKNLNIKYKKKNEKFEVEAKGNINIIKKLSDLGFKKIITTPHIMSDLYRNDSKTIINGLKVLQREVVKQKIDINLSAAAEYYIDYQFVQNIGKQDFLTFGNNFLLIEHSFHEAPKDFFNIIFSLQTEGYNVVLAHPERYQFYQIDD